MARIHRYTKGNVTLLDTLIGTDVENQKATVNIPISAIVDLANSNFSVDGINQSLQDITTSIDGNTTSIATYQNTVNTHTSEIESIVTRTETLESTFETSEDGTLTISAANITNFAETIASEGFAQATTVDSLSSRIFDPTTNTLSQSFANSVMTTESTTDYAAASDVTKLNAQFGFDESGDITGISSANVDIVRNAVAGDGYASATDLDLLKVVVEGEDGEGGLAATVASIGEAQVGVSKTFNQDEAPSVDNPTNSVWYDTNDGNKAYILEESIVPTDPKQWVELTDARLGELDSIVSASRTFKVVAGEHVAGMKIGANDVEGGYVSFLADSFRIYNGTATETPFEIVNGVVKIKEGAISTVSFGDLSDVPPSFTTTIIYANDGVGTSASTTKGTRTHIAFYNGEWSDGDSVSGISFDKISGSDGASVNILGSIDTVNDLPTSGNTNGDGYLIGGNLYVWDGSAWIDAGNIQGPAGVDGINGTDGTNGINGIDGVDGYTPVKGVDYFDGKDGSFVSFIYKVSNAKPSSPTGGSYNGATEVVPSGWTDNPSVNEEDVEWMSTTRYSHNAATDTWSNSGWSTPAKIYQKGIDGYTPVKGVDYFDGLPGTDGSDGDSAYQAWLDSGNTGTTTDFLNSLIGQDGAGGTDGLPGAPGADGVTTYTWIKYADNASGTIGFSNDPTDKPYIGFAFNKTTDVESDNEEDYTWSLIKGADGIDGYTPVKGIDYFDGTPGADGSDGDNAYQLWLNAGNTGSELDFLNSLIGADGVHGTDGIPGEPGLDGTTLYTWIKYADSSDGTVGFSNTPADKPYIGFAFNKTTNTESDDPDDYTWSLIKGADGTDGQDGQDGQDGTNGRKTATGVVFYQSGSASQPSVPSISGVLYNFNTGSFTGLNSSWGAQSPEMAAGTASNKYWTSRFNVIESSPESGTGTPSFATPVRAFAFNQVVTFDSLGSGGTTVIDGGNIKTGIISSKNYQHTTTPTEGFSDKGMAVNLDNGSIHAERFFINADGTAKFNGIHEAGKLGNWVVTNNALKSGYSNPSIVLDPTGRYPETGYGEITIAATNLPSITPLSYADVRFEHTGRTNTGKVATSSTIKNVDGVDFIVFNDIVQYAEAKTYDNNTAYNTTGSSVEFSIPGFEPENTGGLNLRMPLDMVADYDYTQGAGEIYDDDGCRPVHPEIEYTVNCSCNYKLTAEITFTITDDNGSTSEELVEQVLADRYIDKTSESTLSIDNMGILVEYKGFIGQDGFDHGPCSFDFEYGDANASLWHGKAVPIKGRLDSLAINSKIKITRFRLKHEWKDLAVQGNSEVRVFCNLEENSGWFYSALSKYMKPVLWKEDSGTNKRVVLAENGLQVRSNDGYAAIGDVTAGTNVAEFWGDIQIAGNVASTTVSTLAVSAFSDKRLKENISAIESPVDLVGKLNPVKYDWKPNMPNLKDLNVSLNEKYGFLAQEIEKVLPTAILKNKNKIHSIENPLSVEYNNIIAINTAAIKELIESVNDLKEEIKTLKENNG